MKVLVCEPVHRKGKLHKRRALTTDFDGPVPVHQQVGGFEVTMHHHGTAAVQVIHACKHQACVHAIKSPTRSWLQARANLRSPCTTIGSDGWQLRYSMPPCTLINATVSPTRNPCTLMNGTVESNKKSMRVDLCNRESNKESMHVDECDC